MPFPQKDELKAKPIHAGEEAIQARAIFSFIQQLHLHSPLALPSACPRPPPRYEGFAAAIT